MSARKYSFSLPVIRKLVERDVCRIVREAKILIRLDENDQVYDIFRNPAGRLSVLAVIGRSSAFGNIFHQAVIFEIGFGRSRPYAPACVREKNLTRRHIEKRRKWFFLTERQYQNVAPFLFKILQEETNRRVWSRKTNPDNPYFLPSVNHYFTVRGKKVIRGEGIRAIVNGACFTVAKCDMFAVNDIFYSELNSDRVNSQLVGLARFVDKTLMRYRNYSGRKSFKKLARVCEIRKMLSERLNSSLPDYQLIKMLDYFPQNSVKPELAEIVRSLVNNDSDQFWQLRAAKQALEKPERRLNGINLRVTSDVRPIKNTEIVVFEVFPKITRPARKIAV